MDTEEIIYMDDKQFNNLVHSQHNDFSQDENNLWLDLVDEITNGREEVINSRKRLWSLLEEEAKHDKWYGGKGYESNRSTTSEPSIYDDELVESDKPETPDLYRDGINAVLL